MDGADGRQWNDLDAGRFVGVRRLTAKAENGGNQSLLVRFSRFLIGSIEPRGRPRARDLDRSCRGCERPWRELLTGPPQLEKKTLRRAAVVDRREPGLRRLREKLLRLSY